MGILTTKEAAKILGVSAVRVRQWIGEDRLKAEKFGRDHLIDTTEIGRFKKNGRRTVGISRGPYLSSEHSADGKGDCGPDLGVPPTRRRFPIVEGSRIWGMSLGARWGHRAYSRNRRVRARGLHHSVQ